MNLNLDLLIPLASQWVKLKEKEILELGQPLSNEMRAFAIKIGVKHPDKIRILLVNAIPLPEQPLLQQACNATGLISNNTAGLTLNYGIYLRKDCVSEIRIYKHELGHVLQYEQLGGVRQFLEKYISQVLTYGYPDAPMEREARNKESL